MSEELKDKEDEELEELLEQLEASGYPKPKEKTGFFEFLNKVFKAKDTTKAANLTEEEIFAVRKLKQAALFAGLMKWDEIDNYLRNRAEIIIAPTLSRKGFLINAAITQRRVAEKAKEEKSSKWFRKE